MIAQSVSHLYSNYIAFAFIEIYFTRITINIAKRMDRLCGSDVFSYFFSLLVTITTKLVNAAAVIIIVAVVLPADVGFLVILFLVVSFST